MSAGRTKSKTLATWLALAGGTLGLHRFYLHGFRDLWAWAYAPLTLLGLVGVQRLREFGQDDRLSWLLMPILGVTLVASMLTAIVHGLTPDERWNAHHNPRAAPDAAGWLAVIGVVVALAIGAAVLMATLAFSAQHLFELQLESAHKPALAPHPPAAG